MDPKIDRNGGLIREISCFFAAILAMGALLCLASPAQAQSDDEAVPAISSAVPSDDSAADSSDDSADSETDYVPSDDSADATTGQVLEIPQKIDPSTLQDGTADSGDGGNQLGSIADYQDQAAGNSVAVFPGAERTPLGVIVVQRFAGSPVVVQGSPGMVPMLPLIAPPSGLGPFPATSPMLMAPRGSGAMPGGWWTRTHR